MTKQQIIKGLNDQREAMCATCIPSNEHCDEWCNDYEVLYEAGELIRNIEEDNSRKQA